MNYDLSLSLPFTNHKAMHLDFKFEVLFFLRKNAKSIDKITTFYTDGIFNYG